MSQSRTEGKVVITIELPDIVWEHVQRQGELKGIKGGPYVRHLVIEKLRGEDQEFEQKWRNRITGRNL